MLIVFLSLALSQTSTAPVTNHPADRPSIQMEDVTAESGIDFVTTSGAMPSTQIIEVKGGGIAIIDMDNDGDFDLFFPNGSKLDQPTNGPGARLYENLGGMRFRDVTASSGIDHHAWSFGCAVGDIDADGLDDIYVACHGPDRLFRNLGGGRFADVTKAAGLGGEKFWGTSAALADLDGDGDLDIYVTNYVECDPATPISPAHFRGFEVINGPRGLRAQPDLLYENLGNGTFVDRSEASGIRAVKDSYGLNVAILDLTQDGLPDIYVGNDSKSNFLFKNLGKLRFEDIGVRTGMATNIEGAEQATMGMAIGDVNADMLPDILTTNFSDDTNTLYSSRKDGFFDDRTAQYGIGMPSRTLCGWAAAFVDLDHDCDEDIFIVNGHVYPQATRATMNSDYAQVPLIMCRHGDRFVAIKDSSQGWLNNARRDRSAVFADLDSDGDQDAIISGLNEPVQVLKNKHDGKDDWVIIALDDPSHKGNRHGVGARIELSIGNRKQTRWIIGGGPFQSNTAPQAHFGIGSLPTDATAAEPVVITVLWPDGERSTSTVARGMRTVLSKPAAVSK
ncbi:MAG: CRTAC1 family protein [Planctomycetota bacterium]|nr:CRTAC1 family protein [Planctomycetota bacterium]MDA1262206.1 CRTAC1 family protein [Planctomycetota bacterium]